MPDFQIAGRPIGDGHPVYFIAELSANHGGSIEVAKRTITAAKEAGADAIKLQTYTPDTLTLRSRTPPFIVNSDNVWKGRTLWDLYQEAMTPWEWHAELKQTASDLGLPLFSTPFDHTALAFLAGLGVPAYKIASFELTDLPLVEAVARQGQPMVMSTGMASLGEIEAALQTCRAAGNEQIALMRCVSCYPAKAEDMNLASLRVLRELGVVVGLSDHTRDATVAIAATALGARLIEKHFIIDRSIGGPDSFFSLEPAEFRQMVDAVRVAERAVAEPRFGPAPDERASTAFRRSLFVARDMVRGQTITCEDARSVRPSHGLNPALLPQVLGRIATRDVPAGTPLAWDMVGPHPAVPAMDLQRATLAHARFLLDLRNDEATVRASLVARPAEEREHLVWLESSLTMPERELWVAHAPAGEPVGQLRLDLRPNGLAEVSLAVASGFRGRRIAAGLLRLADEKARARGIQTLTATIRQDNEASLRVFRRAGYYGFVEAVRGVPVWTCERRVIPYS
ncbi:MAG: pseudaminic acid synthase [Myxococcales bacterium]|nr:pseudaminic acid synthase [Myxococcales bacterium]